MQSSWRGSSPRQACRPSRSPRIPTQTARSQALSDSRAGRVRALFAVDLLNEGVDFPRSIHFFSSADRKRTGVPCSSWDAVSAGDGKDCVTVLDFIGEANRQFRFDLRYRAVTGATRTEVAKQIAQGFPFLPAGCSMQLDRVATDIVLRNIRTAIPYRRPAMERELRTLLASEQFRGVFRRYGVPERDWSGVG